MSEDYYAILEVSPSANSREIKESYKRLALRWHPDKNSANRSEAESRFRRIAEAYQVLSDPGRRAAYDSARPDAQDGQQHGGSFGSGSGAFRQFQQPRWSAFRDPFSLYQEVFGSSEDAMSSGVTASLVSETTTVDESGNVTVVKTTVDNGVKVVKVTRNGELVDQTTTVLNQLARR